MGHPVIDCIGYIADMDLVSLVIGAPHPGFYEETRWSERPLWEDAGKHNWAREDNVLAVGG